MRLIDAEALKKELDEQMNFEENCRDSVFDIIDNAPTVEMPKAIGTVDKNGDIKIELIRPHGEWQEPFESNGKTYHKCTHCHISSQLILFGNFCPNCGADMRKGDES